MHEKLSENISPMARPNVVVLIQTSDEMSLFTNLTNKLMKFVNHIVNVYNLKVSYSQLVLKRQITTGPEDQDNL